MLQRWFGKNGTDTVVMFVLKLLSNMMYPYSDSSPQRPLPRSCMHISQELRLLLCARADWKLTFFIISLALNNLYAAVFSTDEILPRRKWIIKFNQPWWFQTLFRNIIFKLKPGQNKDESCLELALMRVFFNSHRLALSPRAKREGRSSTTV